MKKIPPMEKAFDEGYYDRIERLARALKRDFFRQTPHFDTVRQLIEKLDDGNLHRVMSFEDMLGFLNPAFPQRFFLYDRIHQRHFQPCIVGIGADPNSFFYEQTDLPIYFNLEHIKRSKRGHVHMGEESLANLTAMALLFIKILDHLPHVQEKLGRMEGLPFFIPGQNGLFLCHACRMLPWQKEGRISLLRMRNDKGSGILDPKLSWKPALRVFVNSYLSYKDLYKDPTYMRSNHRKDVIGHEFDNIFYSLGMTDALSAMWKNFLLPLMANENAEIVRLRASAGLAFHRHSEVQIPRLEDRIRYLLTKPVWQVVFQTHHKRAPIEHIEARKLPDLPCLRDPQTQLERVESAAGIPEHPHDYWVNRVASTPPGASVVRSFPAFISNEVTRQSSVLPGLGGPLEPAPAFPFSGLQQKDLS